MERCESKDGSGQTGELWGRMGKDWSKLSFRLGSITTVTVPKYFPGQNQDEQRSLNFRMSGVDHYRSAKQMGCTGEGKGAFNHFAIFNSF